MITQTYIDNLSYKVIGCAIEVHKYLGPGLLESVYEKCFLRELELNNINYISQAQLPLKYKSVLIESALRIDILVEDLLLIELKAVESILAVHEAQILTYLKLLKKPKGILLNFNCTNIFREGQKTFITDIYSTFSHH